MILRDFQQEAVEKLSKTFMALWKTGKYNLPLTFQAPTGAGKTIVMADFLKSFDSNYHFDDDKAYIWISFGGDDSYLQSKDKLYSYFNDGVDMTLRDKNDLSQKELAKNNIFFINWSKIKTSTKDGRVLRKETERTSGEYGVFDEYILNTRKKRDLVLIIDEAHTETNTSLADEVIDLINPRIIIKVSATPKEMPSITDIEDKKAGYVRVKEEDVIASGLIKSKLIIQTQEEINSVQRDGLSEDEIMLELAMRKRVELKNEYKKLGLDINPLVLIQLPSDMSEKPEEQESKKDSTLRYLNAQGVKEDEIAIWLASEKTDNLEYITNNNNEVNFLLFKVAVATGWDCPRAQVLVMYREIRSPSFHTQIIGRIKRMPEAIHYDKQELNWAYLYTNYNRSHIKDVEDSGSNKVPIFYAKLKKNIGKITLKTTIHKRVDQNSLEPHSKWQKHCITILNDNIDYIKDNLDMTVSQVKNTILVDGVLESFDNFQTDLKDKNKTNETDYFFSKNDVEKLYNLLCIVELQKQEKEEAKYNPTRSWKELKRALNVWFSNYLHMHSEQFYPIIVNDLSKEAEQSVLRNVIHKALVDFREIYQKDLQKKNPSISKNIEIPPSEQSYTDDYIAIENIKKNVYEVFYSKKSDVQNEKSFIEFLERQEKVIWWHKQGDSGSENFAVEYYDKQEKKVRLFYIDFMIKTADKFYIIDTKGGFTAKSQETKDKAEALQKWVKANQDKYEFELIGGIVIHQEPNWLLNCRDIYTYEDSESWKKLKF